MYAVVCTKYSGRNYRGELVDLFDEDVSVFETLEDANDNAEMQWHYLTEKERKLTHICVCIVRDDEPRDEDGNIDLANFSGYYEAEGGFDSESLRR